MKAEDTGYVVGANGVTLNVEAVVGAWSDDDDEDRKGHMEGNRVEVVADKADAYHRNRVGKDYRDLQGPLAKLQVVHHDLNHLNQHLVVVV